MISVYTENSPAVWIPVAKPIAKGENEGQVRAFLPFNGMDGSYTFGFKAEPIMGYYFEALSQIQQAYIDNESKVFIVDDGKKRERQWRAKWRHGNKKGSPLLGPTLGWILVPLVDLEAVSGEFLGEVLLKSDSHYAILEPRSAPPVLCETTEELERESSRILREFSGKVPAGQVKPKKIHGSVDQFARDAAVVAYVLREADGQCECCTKSAPFKKLNGLPYLEVHHVLPLASGGSDRASNAIAVCPNCHRELHHGVNATDIVEGLYARIKRLEREQADA